MAPTAGTLLRMGSLGTPEILVILVLALLVLGPNRLPEAARTAGKWLAEARKITASLQSQVEDVVGEVMHPMQSTASAAGEAYAATNSAVTETTIADGEAPEASDATPSTEDGEDSVVEPPLEQPVPFDPSLN